MNGQETEIDTIQQKSNPFCEKGNLFFSIFPEIDIYLGDPPFEYFGYKLGYYSSFGFCVFDRMSFNFSLNGFIGKDEVENNGSIPSGVYIEWPDLSVSIIPSLSIRRYILLRRLTPYWEAGLTGFFYYYRNMEGGFNDEPFIIVTSYYGGLGLNIPLSRFNVTLTSKYLFPFYKYNIPVNSHLIGSFGLRIEPAITFFLNRKNK